MLAALIGTIGLSACSSVDEPTTPSDEGDAVAYCAIAATIVAGADAPTALIEMVSVAPAEIAQATASAADGDRGDDAQAVEAYALDECGIVLSLGS